VMPQTREHFAICRLLQVKAGIIVLTKSDLVDPETLELSRLEARELVKDSALADAPILPVSAKTGAGLDALRSAIARMAEGVDTRTSDGPPRLPVDRVFSMRGFGTVVTGTLTRGTLHHDEELVVLPSERRVKVRGVQVHGSAQTAAAAGRRVAVNVAGVEVQDVRRGDTLTAPGAFEVTRRFDVALELLPDAKPLRHGARVRFHHGTSELMGRVALAGADHMDTATPDSPHSVDSVAELAPGRRAYGRLRLEGPAVLTRGDRFILRAYSPPITIGGGVVLDPAPARSPIRTAAGVERFRRLNAAPRAAALLFIESSGASGISVDALTRRAGVTIETARTLQHDFTSSGDVVSVGDALFSAPVACALEERLLAAIAAHHKDQPMSDGLPREEARARVFVNAPSALFDHIVQQLTAAGKVSGRERLALAGQGVSLTAEEATARAALDKIFREAGLSPPDVPGAASTAGLALPVADRVSRLLLRQKALVKLDSVLFHAEALARLKHDVQGLKAQQQSAKLDVAAFKERYGVSRKYAIPLLEWLDRERVTRRVGEARVVL
jgi:selenocysteine-specific elongation factor